MSTMTTLADRVIDPVTPIKPWRHPGFRGVEIHEACGQTWHVHGWIDHGDHGHTVCPWDWSTPEDALTTDPRMNTYPTEALVALTTAAQQATAEIMRLRALLTAEPTEAEVKAAAKAMDETFNPDRYPVMAAMFRDYAVVALRAAAEARR